MIYLRCLILAYFLFLLLPARVNLLKNGLALTPPMGWMSWGYYKCSVDCDKNPNMCLNENLILTIADAFYHEGYQEAGYEYIIIDDCWSEKERDENGNLVPDRKRFPNGMKYVADYIHARGLKFGMYTNIAPYTCMHYPGSKGHYEKDAKQFAMWGVDYLKVDGCFVKKENLNKDYITLGKEIKRYKNMVYSCSWPYYIKFIIKEEPDYEMIKRHCNMWRNYHDVYLDPKFLDAVIDHYTVEYSKISPHHGPGHWNDPDMLRKVKSLTKAGLAGHRLFWPDTQSKSLPMSGFIRTPGNANYTVEYSKISPHHGPGHWNDPDMIMVGNTEANLTSGESRINLVVYMMWSAPILLSCDMERITAEEKALLQNLDLVAIGQDIMGIMAQPYQLRFQVTLWVKPRLPKKGNTFLSYSFALVNLGHTEQEVRFYPSQYGPDSTDGYALMDVLANSFPRNLTLQDSISVTVPPRDVILYTLFPL